MDLLQLPCSKAGHNYVLVVVDLATRFVFLRALKDKQMVTIAKRLIKLFADTGFPKIIQSDNGTEFANKIIASLIAIIGTNQRFTTPYHPRANGAAEANVKTAKQTLSKLMEGNFDEWETKLPRAQYAMNTKIAALHNSTPFSLFYCRSPNLFKNYENTTTNNNDINEDA